VRPVILTTDDSIKINITNLFPLNILIVDCKYFIQQTLERTKGYGKGGTVE
jgi:hypothetical protein